LKKESGHYIAQRKFDVKKIGSIASTYCRDTFELLESQKCRYKKKGNVKKGRKLLPFLTSPTL
jgi:hypothetical protein